MNTDPFDRWSFYERTTPTSRKYIQVQTAIDLGCYLAGLIESELPGGSRLRALAIELETEIIAYLQTEYRSGVDEMRKVAEGVRERILTERPLKQEARLRYQESHQRYYKKIKET